jgi:hypothetical protein
MFPKAFSRGWPLDGCAEKLIERRFAIHRDSDFAVQYELLGLQIL